MTEEELRKQLKIRFRWNDDYVDSVINSFKKAGWVKLDNTLKFIESHLVTTIEPDKTLMYHIDDTEWESVKERLGR